MWQRIFSISCILQYKRFIMIFNDGFSIEDAALYGGVMGFVEESVKVEEESEEFDEIADEVVDTYLRGKPDQQLRLLYNDNPGLVRYLIKKAHITRAKAMEREENKDIEEVHKEMLEELQEQQTS